MNLQDIKNRFDIIGVSEKINQAIQIAVQVAKTDLTILVTGESGTGKEVFSKIIHSQSKRKHNEFIAVNCGAIPEGTIDSELFGHEKGSFTGAHESRKGYFEQVNNGTIFLDEVGELPLSSQARLLRVLETGEFIRVGSSKISKTDVRVIAATNVDLIDAVKKGKFREDLYYRLNTVPIKIPALRERKEDIHLLFRKFVSDFSAKYARPSVRLDEQAIQFLTNYSWPGNIRQLKNIAEQVAVLSQEEYITENDLKTFIPDIDKNSYLPVLSELEQKTTLSERELLYQILFEMKKDVNDMKRLIAEIVRQGDFNVPTLQQDKIYPDNMSEALQQNQKSLPYLPPASFRNTDEENREHSNVVISPSDDDRHFSPTEEIEDSLSLIEKEADLIKKALKKYKGKRKKAAQELGISERTLYRKIKSLDL